MSEATLDLAGANIPTDAAVEITGSMQAGFDEILTEDAVAFVAGLVKKYRPTVKELLAARVARQAEYDAGKLPGFLPETKDIREGDWKIRGIPADLQDRRVEITGPVDRKMVINALNAPVKCYMADFEDSSSPTWDTMIGGQINMRDAVNRSISFTNEKNGKQYTLNDDVNTLIVRPRGWHLEEKHIMVDGERAVGGIVDFGLYFFHNAKQAIANGSGPYFYLPKMQSHKEARLWNNIFIDAQKALGIEIGTIKTTILIETLPAAFEMDEILYELKDHIVGLNCGRWDYIFSYIKTLRGHKDRLMPDRQSVGMDRTFLDSYSKLLCVTCHKRGASAMGGMAAFIPVKNDEAANDKAFAKVKSDKEREVKNGHDGTWVAHPGLAPVAMAIFDEHMPTPNQIDKDLGWDVDGSELLEHPEGEITEAGLRGNISVGVQYVEAWISGNGCVPLYNLMEDAATAEISRTQVWQWLHHPDAKLADGRAVTVELFETVLAEEMDNIKAEVGEERFNNGRFDEARKIMHDMCVNDECEEFLTLPAYELLP